MSRIAYVNGRYVPHARAAVHIEDRGYQLADGVYEVCEIFNGRLVDERRHVGRLVRSLTELRIGLPMTARALGVVMRETVRRNRVREGLVYVQITRGVAPRDHAFPAGDVPPAVVVTARRIDREAGDRRAETGVAIVTVPDNRWERVDIKSTNLLPNVMAKQAARERGAMEAWYVDADGMITEGSSTNAWIVDKDGRLVTRPADRGILRGITRAVVLDLARREGIDFVERPFSVEEAMAAREAFATSASTLVMPVVRIDDSPIGNGHPGTMATKLRSLFHTAAEIAEM